MQSIEENTDQSINHMFLRHCVDSLFCVFIKFTTNILFRSYKSSLKIFSMSLCALDSFALFVILYEITNN
ncbi:hypothetical protein AGMMS50222_01340 [Endomicrobiia bacterium]|nr:hypothetical protein AGMMS50222_01340 [Endomicrobiia bacterium]